MCPKVENIEREHGGSRGVVSWSLSFLSSCSSQPEGQRRLSKVSSPRRGC